MKYTETTPIYVPESRSSEVEFGGSGGGGVQKTVFPSLQPSRREDVVLLRCWLADMMGQITEQLPQRQIDQGNDQVGLIFHLLYLVLPTFLVVFAFRRRNVWVVFRISSSGFGV